MIVAAAAWNEPAAVYGAAAFLAAFTAASELIGRFKDEPVPPGGPQVTPI